MPTNTEKLKGKIYEAGFTIESLAKEMKKSAATLSQKVGNQIKFSQCDIKVIAELLSLTPEEIKEIFLS